MRIAIAAVIWISICAIPAVHAAELETLRASKTPEVAPIDRPVPGPVPQLYPTRFSQQGIFFEFGARYWLSSGRLAKDLFGGSQVGLLSRLTYSGLISNSAELFGSVKQIDGLFLKWNGGYGKTVAGTLTDEDFNLPVPAFSTTFSQTTSDQGDGSLRYGTIDLGYNFIGWTTLQAGPFIGFHFLGETAKAFGCVQQTANTDICVPAIPNGVLAITQRADWSSVRLGINADWWVSTRMRLSANAAWLPYTRLDGSDTHHLRPDLPGSVPETGKGSGVQI